MTYNDCEMMDWLNRPGRWVTQWESDKFQSAPNERKEVHFYIYGKYTIVRGKDLVDATNKAMTKYFDETGIKRERNDSKEEI